MIRTVVFDVGGVLAYDVWEHLLLDKFNGVAPKYNLNEQLVEKIGKDLWNKFAYTLKNPTGQYEPWTEKEYWTEFIQGTKVNANEDEFIEMTDKFIRPTESLRDIERILTWLKEQRIHLAILSNNTEFWYKRQMKKLYLDRFFYDESKIMLSCRTGASKRQILENDNLFQHVVQERLGHRPEECIFIDDRGHNVEAGRKRGLISIQIKGVKD